MNLNALYSAARQATARGQHGDALGLLQSALARAPDHPDLLFALANCLRRLGRYDEALASYQTVLRKDPRHADAWFNMALTLDDLSDPMAAARAFARASTLIPGDSAPVHQAVQAMAKAADNATSHVGEGVGLGSFAKDVAVIVCSVNDQRFQGMEGQWRALTGGSDIEIIRIDDARSIAEGYNRGARRTTRPYLVFCHDDIELIGADFVDRLVAQLQEHPVIGIAGATRLSGPAVFWGDQAEQYSYMAHGPMEDGRYMVGVYHLGYQRAHPAAVLDGAFIAQRRDIWCRVPWDERIQGFHMYDVAMCHTLAKVGIPMAIASDLRVVHRSMGDFGESWRLAAQAYLDTHPELASQPGKSHFYAAHVASRTAVERFYANNASLGLNSPVVSTALPTR
jgi:Glycosyltransferase like family/Tetratricopeptide repeat